MNFWLFLSVYPILWSKTKTNKNIFSVSAFLSFFGFETILWCWWLLILKNIFSVRSNFEFSLFYFRFKILKILSKFWWFFIDFLVKNSSILTIFKVYGLVNFWLFLSVYPILWSKTKTNKNIFSVSAFLPLFGFETILWCW